MAIDTSIALGVKTPQFQTIDPMTIYSAMEDQRMNALRERALEQDMQRNALIMQNTMEDRRAAAAKVAQERAQAAEFSRILQGGYKPAKNAIMGPGTIQGATPASFDFEGVKNKLIGAGNVGAFKTVSELQEQEANRLKAQRAADTESATRTKIETETKGFDLANVAKQFDIINAGVDRAVTPDAMYALYRAVPDALATRGQTPETAIKAFNDRVAELTKTLPPDQAFAQARMEVANGAMAVQKQISDIATAQAGRTDVITGADGTTYMLDKVTGVAKPATVAAPAGASAGAPAAAGEPVKVAPKGGLTENQKMQLKARTSDDFGMATETLRYVQDIERDIKSIADADISGATGYQSYFPSFKTDTIRAEKTLTELRDKVGALGRTLASMSGKLGNLAVQEYEFLRQQVALIDPTAGEKDVKSQLAKAGTSMKRIANTVRDRYSREYGGEDNPFPQFRELPKEVGADTKTGAAGTSGMSTGDPEIDALFNKYGK